MSLGFPRQYKQSLLLLITQHNWWIRPYYWRPFISLVTGHRERKMELGRKLPLCCVAIVVPEGVMQDAGEESAAVLVSCGPCELTTKQHEFTVQ